MENRRRGQAALEFLLTYSWAILVVIVIIGALAYFGVLNPQNFIPEKCTLSAGLSCGDYAYTRGASDGTFELAITNGLGRSVDVSSIAISGPDLTSDGAGCLNSTSTAIANGETKVIRVNDATCQSRDGVDKLRATIDINYTYTGSQITTSKTNTGEIFVST